MRIYLNSHQLEVCCVATLIFLGFVTAQERIEMDCNPSPRHRYEICPAGYCCVRDEFLPTFVYCRRFGTQDDNCTTRETESECPCQDGLYCRANIQGQFPSVYGRCEVNVTTTSTTTTTTPTTPTTVDNSTTPEVIVNTTLAVVVNTTLEVFETTATNNMSTVDNSTTFAPNTTDVVMMTESSIAKNSSTTS